MEPEIKNKGRLRKWFEKTFSSKEISNEIVQVKKESKNEDKITDSLGSLATEKMDDFGVDFNNIWKNGNTFSSLGHKDGRIGVKFKDIDTLTLTHTMNISSFIEKKHRGDKEREGLKIQSLKDELDIVKKDFSRWDKYYSRLMSLYKVSFKQFSRPMGWVYLIVGFVLVVADIFLSLNSTRIGFNMTGLEAYTLSFGIAFSTFYIKILYDEFIDNPVETIILEIDEVESLNNFSTIQLQNIRRNQKVRIVTKLIILFITLLTIFFLGYFRYITDNHTSASTPKLILFVCITLLFPLIGGICLSLGASLLHNKKQMKRLVKERDKSKEEIKTIQKEIRIATDKSKNFESIINWATTIDFQNHYNDFFKACYNHGFERGLTEEKLGEIEESSTLEDDLFARAKKLKYKEAAKIAVKHFEK